MKKYLQSGTKHKQRTNNDLSTSASVASKPNVVRRFVEEDFDNCWAHYKSYFIDVLNGDYDLNEAREDLNGLVGSEHDNRTKVIDKHNNTCRHDWKYNRTICVKVCRLCNYAENYVS